jgi:uncharacterized lipoprotein YmbA
MNTLTKLLACIVATALLGACASSPPVRHITLDDGRPKKVESSTVPSVAVVRANVPELIDRPQLVLRTAGNQVTFSEQYRWAEPLRQEIPRVIANDLGELLDSSQVAALPADSFSADYKLTLDFQQLEAVVGQGVDVDVLWRVEHRSGKVFVGRSSFRQSLAGSAADYPALVAAQRQAMRRVAAEIAKEIAAHPRRSLQH